jgi:hypothetical protein
MIEGTVKDEARAREMCELEEALRGRSREIRRQLQVMNRSRTGATTSSSRS